MATSVGSFVVEPPTAAASELMEDEALWTDRDLATLCAVSLNPYAARMLPRIVALLVGSVLSVGACAPEFTIAGTGGASGTSATSSSSGSVRDAGPDAAACETNCADTNALGYAQFVCDGLSQCGCPTGAACSTECGATPGCMVPKSCTLSTASVPMACMSCLVDQYAMTTQCGTNAANTCKGNKDCAALLSCFAGCMAPTPG